MGIRKILLAYDGSEGGDRAVKWVADYVGKGAEILVARVIDLPHEIIGEMPGVVETVRQDAEGTLGNVIKKLDGNCLIATPVILEGEPASELLEYANQEKVDLIVCGSRGLGGFESLLLGSVAHQLVTHAVVPVLVVK